jgi:threonine dehydrogenase-like Zn-dependent dehydrogenase
VAADYGPFDIIVEASGSSPLVFAAAEALGKNGVLVLTSVTGGDAKVEVNADQINQGFVLGNKVMVGSVNASRADFESGVTDLIRAEALYPGWLQRLLTTRIAGLQNYAEMLRALREGRDAIKVYVEVAQEGAQEGRETTTTTNTPSEMATVSTGRQAKGGKRNGTR